MRSHLAFLPFSCLAFWKSKYFVKGKEVFKNLIFLIFFILTCSSILSHFLLSEEKVQYLKKVGEIKEGFSSEKENFFIKISSLCCDDEGNLYVADSGWNKIFKFDTNGKFIMSFGRQGQGPGEFMAHPMRAHIKISFGNDGKLYVNDPGNGRLSIFSKDGKFIKSFRLPPYTYDAPVVNSKGEIYLLSPSGIKVLDHYNENFKLMSSLIDIKEHFSFPYGKPPFPIIERAIEGEVLKLITRNDEVTVISNYSLKVFVFDRYDKNIYEFEIVEKNIREDCEKWIKKLRKDNFWFYPFIAFLDKDGNLCIYYEKIDNTREIYVYSLKGNIVKILQFPKKASFSSYTISSNKKGRIFVPDKHLSNLEIYELSE